MIAPGTVCRIEGMRKHDGLNGKTCVVLGPTLPRLCMVPGCCQPHPMYPCAVEGLAGYFIAPSRLIPQELQ